MKTRPLILLVVILAAAPRAVLAHGGTEVVVEGSVRSNALIEIEGEEFEPNDDVRIELLRGGSEPIELGRVTTDAEGQFRASLHVPARVEAGLYSLEAVGVESASVEVTVLEPLGEANEGERASQSVSSDRPAEETGALAAFAALLGLAGGALIWFSRTRPHRSGI